MSTSLISTAEQILRARHRVKSSDEFSFHKRVVGLAMVVALVATAAALVAVVMASKYAGSIAVVHDVKETNQIGQVIGRSGSISRYPADVQTHSLFMTFGQDAFAVYNSKLALSRNYTEAQGFFEKRSQPERDKLQAYWVQSNSPLHADGSFDRAHVRETDVKLVSVLSRGAVEGGGTEYEVQYQLSFPDDGSNKFLALDVVLVPGGLSTDADPWGLYITHLSISEQK